MLRYCLELTREQETILLRLCSDARFMWNLAVEQHAWWRPGRKSAPGYLEQSRQLTAARADNLWLREGSQTVFRVYPDGHAAAGHGVEVQVEAGHDRRQAGVDLECAYVHRVNDEDVAMTYWVRPAARGCCARRTRGRDGGCPMCLTSRPGAR